MLVGIASIVVFFYSLDENKLLLLIQLSFAVEFISLIIRSLVQASPGWYVQQSSNCDFTVNYRSSISFDSIHVLISKTLASV